MLQAAIGKCIAIILSAGMPILSILSDASNTLSKVPGITSKTMVPITIIHITSFKANLRASSILSFLPAPRL